MSVQEKNERKQDFFVPSVDAKKRWTIVPRVLLVDTEGNIPLLPHKRWYGLFGGHIKLDEFRAVEELNLLDPETTFPTLSREVGEESKVPGIEQHLHNLACLGLAEIEQLDTTQSPFVETNILVPIFLGLTPEISYPSHVHMAKLSRLPKPLYPDAALGLWHLRRNVHNHTKGSIFPDWLNRGRHVVFVKANPESFVKYFSPS